MTPGVGKIPWHLSLYGSEVKLLLLLLLLLQTKITINLIRQSNATPNVLAYAHLSGPFDYNKMPLALLGCNAQVHEKTDYCDTWAFHLVNGWYLFTSPKHYCTHNCHVKHTKSKCLSDTV